MPFELVKEILFENGRRYAKSDNTIKKGLEERIQNYILHVQFEGKTRQRKAWHPLAGGQS